VGLGRGGFPFLQTALMLPLVDSDDLINQGVKGFFFSDGSEGILNRVLKTDIKQEVLGFIVEVQGGNGLLEFDQIHGSRLGLLETGQLVSCLVFDVAVKVKSVESILKSRKIITIRVSLILEDCASPIAGVTSEVRDDEQNLLFVFAV